MVRDSTAIKAMPIGITLSGGTSTNTVTNVKFTNRTTGYYRIIRSVSNEAVVDLCRLSSDGTDDGTMVNVNADEIIDIVAYGYRFGATTYTVATGKGAGGRRKTITCTDVSSTTDVAVNI